MDSGDEFRVRGQTYQGYAVWRAVGFKDPVGDQPPEPDWELVGLYDITNPALSRLVFLPQDIRGVEFRLVIPTARSRLENQE